MTVPVKVAEQSQLLKRYRHDIPMSPAELRALIQELLNLCERQAAAMGRMEEVLQDARRYISNVDLQPAKGYKKITSRIDAAINSAEKTK